MNHKCPVCEGQKRIFYKSNIGRKDRFVQTVCWACRGTGYVEYDQGMRMTDSALELIKKSSNIMESKCLTSS